MDTLKFIKERAHAPGIYLDMPEEEYHADPSFSTSGTKLMTISPLDYWVNSPLNPDYEPRTSAALDLGKAYHKMILEGPEAFDGAFCIAPDKTDYPDALDGAEALRAKCKELELKASGSIADMCGRIREADPAVELWPDIKAIFEEERGERVPLTKDQWKGLKLVQAVLARMENAAKALRGGVSEVSIFWTEYGIPMKARLDKLQPQGIVDLKTFGNVMNKEIISAVAGEIAKHRYYLQPPIYMRALGAAKQMYADYGDKVVHGEAGLIHDALTAGRQGFWFVFVQTGGVPNVVIRGFAEKETFKGLGATTNSYWMRGESDFHRGLTMFKKCVKTFGPHEPWVADFGMKDFTDNDFPLWMLDTPKDYAA